MTRLVCGTVVLCSAFTGCRAEPPVQPLRVPQVVGRLQLLATADVGSDTDVCGCKNKKLGGLARRAGVIADLQGRFDGPTLIVDAGDLFFRRWSVPPRYEAQARRTAQLHADALAEWGVPAVAVGERDLAFGVATLRSLGQRAKVDLLSANLAYAATQAPVFVPFSLVEVDGFKVGLVGASPVLTADDPAHQVYQQAGLTALPVGPAVATAAQAARSAGAEFVIGLLHIGQDEALRVLEALPTDTVDLAVVGHGRVVGGLRLVADGHRGYVQGGERGKWVVAVEATIVDPAIGLVDDGRSEAQQQILKEIDEALARTQDPGKKARLTRRRARLRVDQNDGPLRPAHRVKARLVEVPESAPQDPAMAGLYRDYQSELGALADIDVEDADIAYVGHEACASCHRPAYRHWLTTGHAQAWRTMVRTRQTTNLDCIGCHVTGFERAGGPRRLADLRPFRNVGCESCHGPGSVHAQDPTAPMDYGRSVPERVCAECHRAQADQKPFDYADRLKAVVGPGHGGESPPTPRSRQGG